jgi:hypothetical protein
MTIDIIITENPHYDANMSFVENITAKVDGVFSWTIEAFGGFASAHFEMVVPEKATVDEKYTEEEKVPVKKTRIVQRPNGAGGYINVQEEYTEYEVKKVEKVRQVEKTVADKVKEQDDVLPAPWLPGKEMGGLIKLTGSKVPIVRADYFINQARARTLRILC